jgi:hypothetical protein
MPNSSALVLRDYIKHLENSQSLLISRLPCVIGLSTLCPLGPHVVETKQPKQDIVSKSQIFMDAILPS